SVIPGLNVNIDFDDYYPNKDPELNFFHHVKKELGNDEHILLVAVEAGNSLFDPGFLHKIKDAASQIRSLQEVKRVSDLTSLKSYKKSPFGIISSNYIKPGKARDTVDFSKLAKDSLYTKRFYNQPRNAIYLYVQLIDTLHPVEVDNALNQITSVLEDQEFEAYHLMGRKYLESEYKKIVNRELGRSVIYTLAVIVVILFFFFRSIKGILFPVVSMILALVMLYGSLAVLNRDLHIMSNLFPTIILIVGISDIIHILSGYDFEFRRGFDIHTSTKLVLHKIGTAIFLTSITTAIGFMTLCTSSMKAISSFGIEAAIAVLIAFVFSILWAPLFLYQFNIKIPVHTKKNQLNWAKVSRWIHKIVVHRSGLIWVISVIVLMASFIGISRINYNNLQVTNIPLDHRLRSDFKYFDELLGGSRTFELLVSSDKESGLRDKSHIAKFYQLHKYLESFPEINGIISPYSWYQLVVNIYDRSLNAHDIEDQQVIDKFVDGLPLNFYAGDWKLVNKNENIGRFSGRMKDIGRLEVIKINKKINQWIEDNNFPPDLKFQVSGTDHMIDRGHYHRIKNMIQGLVIALVAVSVLIALIFRSRSLLFISLIVNLFPIIIVAGIMGFAGIEMRGSTTILFTIGFVIAIDDTLHLISKYQYFKKEGLPIELNLEKSILEAGRAIVTTSVILIGGFLVLLHSQSWDIRTLGILVSLMLFVAVIVDLFLLPSLIFKFDKR
ncbi:MAG: MMPL family transporter, partial [Bacteroidia bacterium]|nr:MMPL family transporter [Bacteroidia bacterium]